MHIATLDVCSILVLTITRSSGVIRDQLVSLALPTENKLLEAYHNWGQIISEIAYIYIFTISRLISFSSIILSIENWNFIFRNQLVSSALPAENEQLKAYHNEVKLYLKSEASMVLYKYYMVFFSSLPVYYRLKVFKNILWNCRIREKYNGDFWKYLASL